MTKEAFKHLIELLKAESDKLDKIYKLGIDLYNFNDELQGAITLLLKSHYSEQGEDMISWWLYEDTEKFLYSSEDNSVVNDLTKIDDLWEYVEEIRKSADFKEYAYVKERKKTKKQMEKMIKNMLKF